MKKTKTKFAITSTQKEQRGTFVPPGVKYKEIPPNFVFEKRNTFFK